MKRLISVIILSLALIATLVPASIISANTIDSPNNDSALLQSIPSGTPYTIYYTDQGNIRNIKSGLPDGFKMGIVTNTPKPNHSLAGNGLTSIVTPMSVGWHQTGFNLSTSNRTYLETWHTHNYIVGNRQDFYCVWTPDSSAQSFIGLYNTGGGYAIGMNLTSPVNGFYIVIGNPGTYCTQVTYLGFSSDTQVYNLRYYATY